MGQTNIETLILQKEIAKIRKEKWQQMVIFQRSVSIKNESHNN